MTDIFENKKDTRKYFKDIRASLSDQYRQDAEFKIYSKVLELQEYQNAKTILGFYPVGTELNILPLIRKAFIDGKKVAFPVSDVNCFTLIFKYINNLDELVLGAYSIPEPPEISETYGNEADTLCIVPALAYDRIGNRIGYGKGFYDRFLTDFKGITIGLAYDECLCDKLPTDTHDKSLDIIITNREELFIYEKSNK